MDEINEGNRLFLEKKFQDAIKKYNIVLDKEPDNLIALNNMGYSLSKLNHLKNSSTELAKKCSILCSRKDIINNYLNQFSNKAIK